MALTLRQLREQKAMLSQTELAAKLGVTKQSVWDWEHGRARPAFKHRRELLAIFDCTKEELSQAIEATANETPKDRAPASCLAGAGC